MRAASGSSQPGCRDVWNPNPWVRDFAGLFALDLLRQMPGGCEHEGRKLLGFAKPILPQRENGCRQSLLGYFLSQTPVPQSPQRKIKNSWTIRFDQLVFIEGSDDRLLCGHKKNSSPRCHKSSGIGHLAIKQRDCVVTVTLDQS